MSVRKQKRRDTKTGEVQEFWMVDVVYQHPDGRKERVRQVPRPNTAREAERLEKVILKHLNAGGTYEQAPKEVKREIPTLRTFAAEFITNYSEVHNKPSEVAAKTGNLERYLLPSLGALRLDQIGVREIDTLVAELLRRGLKPKTVNNALGTLGRLLRYAVECNVGSEVPRIRMLRAEPPAFDFLTFEEAEKLLEAARFNPEWHSMILFALRTGVRYGELCELRWKDIDFVAKKVIIRRNYYRGNVGTPKGGRPREIPLSSQTVEMLLQMRHLKGGLVFCKDDGGTHIHRRADVALKRCCRRAGLREIGWHVLRHTFASHLVMRGASLKSVQELLGHTTIEMTMRYAHLAPEVNQGAVALLDQPSPLLRVTAT